MKRKFECGSFTIVGPIKGKPAICGHKRLMCASLRCTLCQKKRLGELRVRISELAHGNGLTQFVTLTLDPKKIEGVVRQIVVHHIKRISFSFA